jgi:hypothetical protein|tara:strand:+ start:138 stop:263 length:126 start_codon:yes stop_codon:yes gene_type:complete
MEHLLCHVQEILRALRPWIILLLLVAEEVVNTKQAVAVQAD